MNNTLRKFTTETLFDATSALLTKLNIKFNRTTAEPIQLSDYFDNELPKYVKEALSNIAETYFIGVINEDSLHGKKTGESLNDKRAEVQSAMDAECRYDGMFVFACEAKMDANLTRTAAATLTRAFNRVAIANPVILVIRQGDMLSLSTCERMEYTQEWRRGTGEKLGKVSILRNVNCADAHRGHCDILAGLDCNDCTSFDKLYEKWMKTFNSDVLTKKFYDDLFEWYQWAVSKEAKVSFPNDTSIQSDDREDIDTRVIRLITRLMFVWFIKQKGLVPDKIFRKEYVGAILRNFEPYSTSDSNYYQAILQNLFFGTLNRPIIEDGEVRGFAKNTGKEVKNLYRYEELFSIPENEVIELFSTVPFLNCGLFECLDKTKSLDGVEHCYNHDGFSRNDKKFKDGTFRNRAVVPNILFFHKEKGLISIFDKYVFTVEENTPQDVQVALDPELLGKVFENLLGAYNPETKDPARNQSGSFYTPREIVQYMVNESLVAHLKRTVDENLEDKYRQLLDFRTEEVDLTPEQRKKIVHSIFTCKILDPACGSGAFPMGMLQQMVHVLQQVDPDNSQWKEVLLNLAVDESRRAFGIIDEEERKKKLLEIEETFNNGLNSPDYTRKLYIIESCIYGIDIQPIAMLITRLRFFITLVCEQKEMMLDKPEKNFGIKTLPNLESKFVAANSLMDADIHKYNEDWTNNEELALLKNELLAIRHRHFYTRKRSEKTNLLKKEETIRQDIHKLIDDLVAKPNQLIISENEKQIAEYETQISKYEGEDWIEEKVMQDLFSTTPTIVRVDRNKRERDKIVGKINDCQHAIEHEKNKKTPSGFEAAVIQITNWNPYDQNTVSPFLDIEWMFGITDGFDIVIGNPPYISAPMQMSVEKLKKQRETLAASKRYDSLCEKWDLYIPFMERGMQLLKDDAVFTMIVPYPLTNQKYGRNLRQIIASKYDMFEIADLNGVKVFENATVTNCIPFIRKSINNVGNIGVTHIRADKTFSTDYIKTYADLVQDPDTLVWNLTNEKREIKHTDMHVLGDFCYVSYGLRPNSDEKTAKGEFKKEDLISDTYDIIHSRKYIEAKDIEPYKINRVRYLEYGTKRSPQKLVRPTFEEWYKPAKLFFNRLGDLKGTVDYDNELIHNDSIIGCALWYDIHGVINNSISGSIKKYSRYTREEMEAMSEKIDIRYILGIMNSKYAAVLLANLRGGDYHIYPEHVRNIPIPLATCEKQHEIVIIVDKILSEKKSNPNADTTSMEKEIDMLVYDLYGLTQEEINSIENKK